MWFSYGLHTKTLDFNFLLISPTSQYDANFSLLVGITTHGLPLLDHIFNGLLKRDVFHV